MCIQGVEGRARISEMTRRAENRETTQLYYDIDRDKIKKM